MPDKTLRNAGLLVTALLSFAVLSCFYGNLFNKLNRVSFASGGDGLQSYINMEYHIRYDSTYMRCNSMNYPYGEHVFFTNNQPLFSNTVKFISENIIDISDYTLGMLNFLMLFSLVITPVILYLIFTHIGVGKILSVIASVGISYLSPQLDRFGGHFNLSYVCAIPWMILLLLRFFKKPNSFLSVLIFLSMLAAALTHFYLYGFCALLVIFFYISYLFKGGDIFKSRKKLLLHFAFQLILPFLILQAFYISDHVTDRPAYPWGFLYYRAYLQSVFLPLGRPYGQFLHSFVRTDYIDWEGYAYVGIVALMGTLFIMVRFFRNLLQKKYHELTRITSNRHINILFWAAFAGLLYSFGLPFILGLEWLVDLIGPIRQMRGIARFAWLYFYIMNIVTIYWLWIWWKNPEKKWLKSLVVCAALFMLLLDACYNVRNRGKSLENYIPALTDSNLKLPENQWIRRIGISHYQAIIPIPYFHVGSENIWIDGGCGIVNQCFISIKNSGLPCLGVMLSRTSISQTIENVALMLGPDCKSVNTSRFPSQKPFLLMVARCDMLKNYERNLIQHAAKIDSSGMFDIYRLPFTAFHEIADSLLMVTKQEFNHLQLINHGDVCTADSAITYQFLDFDSLNNSSVMNGSGCYIGKAKNKNELFNGYIPGADTGKAYSVSFWMNNVSGDLYPRSQVALYESDPKGNHINSLTCQAFTKFAAIDGNRVLIEFRFRLSNPQNRIILTIQNKALRNKWLNIDDVLVRPETTDVFRQTDAGLWKNNRNYVACTE